jgi:hypothetical protein
VFNYTIYVEPNGKVIGIGELGRMWMEAALPYFASLVVLWRN